MAFVLKKSATFEWPVKFHVPVGGKHQAQQFTGEFEILDTEEINAIVQTVDEKTGNTRLIERVLVGLKDIQIQDEDGNAVKEIADQVAIIARSPLTSGATVEAYFKGLAGHRAKN